MNKFYFAGLGMVDGIPDVRVVVLVDEAKETMFSVVVDEEMGRQIQMRMNPPQELCKRLLPEVLIRVLAGMWELENLLLQIYDEHDGVYLARLIHPEYNLSMELRFSDAVLFSMIAQCPIFCADKVVQTMGLPYNMGNGQQRFPLDALPVKLLEHSLEQAIQREDYRMAAQIKTVLAKRKEDGLSKN